MATIRSVFFLFILFRSFLSFATGDELYNSEKINKGLLTDASAVLRDYNLEINIESPNKIFCTEHYVITILSEKGDEYAEVREYFGKLKKIEGISGYLYDARGKEVLKIKESDFRQLSIGPEYTDVKYKVYRPAYKQYPYTVEYTISSRQRHTFFIPVWSPQPDPECAVEKASLIVNTNPDFELRYKSYEMDHEPEIKIGREKTLNWTITNIKARLSEPFSSNGQPQTPTVVMAANEFMIDEYKGNMSNWQNYGKFIYDLNEGRDKLPAVVRDSIKALVSGLKDPGSKMKAIYSYMQRTTRYVAIEYGIGGWQTLDAEFLSKNHYGDCKALTNYMMALLNEAGINSYPVLIYASEKNYRKLMPDFPCNQFNHVILCVPNARDTVWLECTSSDLPVNYLGNFTQDRNGLMITPKGGFVVHTPVYDTSVNRKQRHAYIALGADNILKIDMDNAYSGSYAYDLRNNINFKTQRKIEEYLNSKFDLASYTVEDYSFRDIDSNPYWGIEEKIKMSANSMLTKAGSKSFLSIDIAPIKIKYTIGPDNRGRSFYFPASMAISDTFEFKIPPGQEIEYLPDPVQLKYPFGYYNCAVTQDGDRVVMVRKFVEISGTYEAKLYAEYLRMLDITAKQWQKRVVLRSK